MSNKLNLTVDLDSNEELRSHIRQMIDDQVKSILREEFRDLIKTRANEILNKKDYDNTISHIIHVIIEREIKDSISRIINDNKDRNYFSLDGYIKNYIDIKINVTIKEALNNVDIEKVMQQRSEKIVEQLFDNMIKKK